MAIVTYSYYTETYMGETVAENDFPQMEAKAERLVKQITHGRAAGNGWTIGDMHINGSSANVTKNVGASTMVCAAAVAALEQTGLLNPQVDTLGEPFVTPWGWFI